MKHGGETVGHQPGFLLDRIRRRARPRTGKQGNRSANAGRARGMQNLCATGSGRIDNEVSEVRADCRSAAPHGVASPRSPEQSRFPQSRSICVKGHDLQPVTAIRRNNGGGISTMAFSRPCGVGWQRRRNDDQSGTDSPAASCANRFGSSQRIACCRSVVAPLHSPISARVRPQPVQNPARASSAQTSTQGDFGRSIILPL